MNTIFHPTGGFYQCKTEPRCTIHVDKYYTISVHVNTVFSMMCLSFKTCTFRRYCEKLYLTEVNFVGLHYMVYLINLYTQPDDGLFLRRCMWLPPKYVIVLSGQILVFIEKNMLDLIKGSYSIQICRFGYEITALRCFSESM